MLKLAEGDFTRGYTRGRIAKDEVGAIAMRSSGSTVVADGKARHEAEGGDGRRHEGAKRPVAVQGKVKEFKRTSEERARDG